MNYNANSRYVARPPQNKDVAAPIISYQNSGASSLNNGRAYGVPRQFTLFADNSAGGAAVIFKMQSADNLVELDAGSIGASSFTVPELPNRAGLASPSASTLLGVDGVRAFLLTYAVRIEYINYAGSTAAQLNNACKVWNSRLDGGSHNTQLLVGRDISNQQYNGALIPIGMNLILTANHAISLNVGTGLTATLVMAIDMNVLPSGSPAGLVPYNVIF